MTKGSGDFLFLTTAPQKEEEFLVLLDIVIRRIQVGLVEAFN